MDYRLKRLYENMYKGNLAKTQISFRSLTDVYSKICAGPREVLSEEALLAEEYIFEDADILEEARYGDKKWEPRYAHRVQAEVSSAILDRSPLYYCSSKSCEEPSWFIPTKSEGDPNILIVDKNSVISGEDESGNPVTIPVKWLIKDTEPNKGEVAEGVLGTCLFLRMIRPVDITADSVIDFITGVLSKYEDKDARGNRYISVQIRGSNPEKIDDHSFIEYADNFTLLIKLKKIAMRGFLDREFLINKMGKLIRGVVGFANRQAKKYGDYFRRNKKADTIAIKSDGVSGEGALKPKKEKVEGEEPPLEPDISKTDVEVYINQETEDENGQPKTIKRVLKHLNLSVKVGGTKQIGQHGGLGADSSLEDRFDVVVSFWDRFGIDIKSAKPEFIQQSDIAAAYTVLYNKVAEEMNKKFNLLTETGDVELVKNLGKALQFYGSANKSDLSLVQFTNSGGFYTLDFNKLGRLLEKDIHKHFKFGARVVNNEDGLPKLEIVNTISSPGAPEKVGKNDIFLSIRMYRTSNGYVRNYVEKGAGLVKLLKVREWEDPTPENKKEKVQQTKKKTSKPKKSQPLPSSLENSTEGPEQNNS